jgi:membrane peptidoglycan carboxypeptidase
LPKFQLPAGAWRRRHQAAANRDALRLRIEALDRQTRTLTYLLYSCISQLDALLGNARKEMAPPPPNGVKPAARLVRRQRRQPRRGPLAARRSIPLVVALTLLAPALVGTGAFATLTLYDSYVDDLVAPEQIALNVPLRGARVYDRYGELLYEFVDDEKGIRIPIALNQMSDAFLAATIATEDESFYSNPGVNPRGLARAAWENFSPLSEDERLTGSGGSSITQQLIKNVYIDPEERAKRSIDRKVREALYAIELTDRYDKDRILTWYVNEISYGGLYNGIEAAAQGYFGKSTRELTLPEAALLAGIPQSPAAYDPRTLPEAALIRRNEVLDLMLRAGRLQIGHDRFFEVSVEEIEAAKAAPLEIMPQVNRIEAPHFILEHLTPELEALFGREALLRDGLVVTTSLDMNLQREAQGILERWISEFENVSNSRNGALIVLDAPTGEIRVWIGSRDYYREDLDGNVDNLTALNSPGSSFKPFVYLTSFIRLGWTPSTIVQDTPVTYRESNGTVFQPRNPNRSLYQGPITIRNALGNSLNVPPFKVALQLGVPAIVDTAKRLGFTTLHGQYGPAIAIGGVDLSLADLSTGYSVLANNGALIGQEAVIPHRERERAIDPVSILRVEDRHGNLIYDAEEHRRREQVAPAEQAYMISSILSDPRAQCITFGCGGISIPGRVAGVKTGTSEPYDPSGPNAGKIGETWAFGFTPDYVVGVWAGNSDNSPVVNILSTSISYRVMRDTLQAAHRGAPSRPFPRPPGIEERRVCSTGNVCATDLFIRAKNVQQAVPAR